MIKHICDLIIFFHFTAIKREYEASIYQASSILPMGAQPLLNSHFKDGATDPFCGGFNETKERLNLAW